MHDSFPAALDALCTQLKRRTFAPDVQHVVLTPDRYTLNVENALFCGGGALDCEVLTLSRLSKRLAGGKSLSREGGVMLVARAISAVAGKLTYYKRASGFSDFARSALDCLDQLASSGVEPQALFESGAVRGAAADKLHDLALIKREYDILKADCLDPPDKLRAIIEQAKTNDAVKHTHFYAIGYADATRLNMDVFDALAASALSFTFFDAARAELLPRPDAEVYCAPDKITQYKAVAARIRGYVYGSESARYGDVAVICPDPKTLSRILREYDIDFYADDSVPLDETPPLNALAVLYRLTRGEWAETEDIISLAKNPFSGCDRADAEQLQDYYYSHGRTYTTFDGVPEDDGALRAFERVKQLKEFFASAGTRGFTDACESVMDRADFDGAWKRLTETASGSGDDVMLSDIVSPVRALVSLVKQYGGGAFETDAKMFFAAAHAACIRSLPRYADRVTVCMPETLRLTRCRKLFITDFNEGVLPAYIADSGLLSDGELGDMRAAVESGAIARAPEPTVRDINRRARAELAAVINNAHSVFCTYHISDGEKQSAFLAELGGTERTYAGECAALKISTDANFIARIACAPDAAREIAARGQTGYSEAIRDAVGGGRSAAPFEPSIGDIKLRSLSVTELSGWFDCPYKRFLTHSIGIKERSGGLNAPNFGIVMHEFMQRFIEEMPEPDELYDFAERTVDGALAAIGLEIKETDRSRLIANACDYAEINRHIIEAGDYKPEYTELAFGGDLRLGRSRVPLNGKIDRIDVQNVSDGMPRARIMDYKTSDKQFDISDCYNGRDMQLPLYAAQISGRYDVTGMFYVPLRSKTNGDTRLNGCLVGDGDIPLGYDKKLGAGEESDVIKLSSRSKQAMSREQFDGLIKMCTDTASLAADEIESGYIERAPADGACDHCPYAGLCDSKKVRGNGTEDEL